MESVGKTRECMIKRYIELLNLMDYKNEENITITTRSLYFFDNSQHSDHSLVCVIFVLSFCYIPNHVLYECLVVNFVTPQWTANLNGCQTNKSGA
jgi:hypothetical protein